MRDSITGSFYTSLEGSNVVMHLFGKLEFSGSANVTRVWTGDDDIEFEGETYLGAGRIGTITLPSEDIGFDVKTFTLQIPSMPSEIIAIAILGQYKNRPVTIWQALVDEDDHTIITNRVLIRGRMVSMITSKDADNASITLHCENMLSLLLQAPGDLLTHERQISDYPDDRGFEYTTAIQEVAVYWGNKGKNKLPTRALGVQQQTVPTVIYYDDRDAYNRGYDP